MGTNTTDVLKNPRIIPCWDNVYNCTYTVGRIIQWQMTLGWLFLVKWSHFQSLNIFSDMSKIGGDFGVSPFPNHQGGQIIFCRLPKKCWNWVSFLIFHFLTLKLLKTKEILFRWFVLCAWQRNYGHLLCGPLNQARCRCKYFVTQVWTWGLPVCIFCEVRTFANDTDTTFSLSVRQSITTMS